MPTVMVTTRIETPPLLLHVFNDIVPWQIWMRPALINLIWTWSMLWHAVPLLVQCNLSYFSVIQFPPQLSQSHPDFVFFSKTEEDFLCLLKFRLNDRQIASFVNAFISCVWRFDANLDDETVAQHKRRRPIAYLVYNRRHLTSRKLTGPWSIWSHSELRTESQNLI